jgi:uncharacterized protein
MKALASIVSVAALLYVGVCALLYFGQRALIYFPTPAAPAPGAERIVVHSEGESILVLRIGPATQRAIIYFGGNAEDVAQNIPLFNRIFTQASVYLVNYRGYGGSTGSPSERALFADALAVFDYVRARHAEVSVIGRSLGSGVAVYLASARDVGKMALVTPYDSLAKVARRHYPWLPVALLLQDRFASDTRIAAIRIPVLFVVAGDDEVIPRANSDALIALLPSATVVLIPGASHNTVDLNPLYAESLRRFL